MPGDLNLLRNMREHLEKKCPTENAAKNIEVFGALPFAVKTEIRIIE